MTLNYKEYRHKKTGKIIKLKRRDPKSRHKSMVNILLSDEGLVWLSDFQLKRQYDLTAIGEYGEITPEALKTLKNLGPNS